MYNISEFSYNKYHQDTDFVWGPGNKTTNTQTENQASKGATTCTCTHILAVSIPVCHQVPGSHSANDGRPSSAIPEEHFKTAASDTSAK